MGQLGTASLCQLRCAMPSRMRLVSVFLLLFASSLCEEFTTSHPFLISGSRSSTLTRHLRTSWYPTAKVQSSLELMVMVMSSVVPASAPGVGPYFKAHCQ